MPTAAALVLTLVAAFAIAGVLTLFMRRPRLTLDASLRGGTREGTLYVVVGNVGGLAAHRARVEVAWERDTGERALVGTRELGVLPAADATRLEVDDLQRPIRDAPEGWARLVVTLRARDALRVTRTLPVQRNVPARAAPVTYARDLPCPTSPDGEHAREVRRVVNDGVTETWEVCRRCQHPRRRPLSPADEATQRRVRAERVERARREVEAELARAEAEHARPRAEQKFERFWREPERAAPDDDTFPPEIALMVLGLDEHAGWDDVVAAHRRLAKEHHPDARAGADDATRAALERKMQDINRARDRLREHFGARTSS